MKRFGLILALAVLVAAPGEASAFYRWWCAPPPYAPFGYGYGRYAFPLLRPYAVPLYAEPLPQAYPAIPPAFAPRTYAPPAPARAPVVTVTPGMPPVELDPLVRPATGGIAVPSAAPAPMIPPTAIPDPVSPKTAPLVIPPLPGSDAKPTPAPAPPAGTDPLPLIPLPEPRKVPDGKPDLPPLVLPPETPGEPSGVIPPTTSRASPLAAGVKVQVFTASGNATGTLLRKIGFFNHTNRDLDLVIEGKAVKLPKKSYLHAELPANFTWKHSDGAAEIATVPTDAVGLDVLFKE